MKYSILDKEQLKRVLETHKVIDNDNHWLWKGSISSNGYGMIEIQARKYNVHRISAYVYLGLNLDDNNEHALHKPECHYKKYHNPEHLYIGTQSDNTRDSIKAGTFRNQNTNKTTCKNGHELTKENIYLYNRKRCCKTCRNLANIRRRKKVKNELDNQNIGS